MVNITGLGGIYELEKAVYFDTLDDEQRGLISFADWLALVGNFLIDLIILQCFKYTEYDLQNLCFNVNIKK